MTARADAEACARVLARADGVPPWPPRSECAPATDAVIKEYEARAGAALEAVRCSLVGKECTCWTFDALVRADRELQAAAP